jgi:hypothetical protein
MLRITIRGINELATLLKEGGPITVRNEIKMQIGFGFAWKNILQDLFLRQNFIVVFPDKLTRSDFFRLERLDFLFQISLALKGSSDCGPACLGLAAGGCAHRLTPQDSFWQVERLYLQQDKKFKI